MNEEIRKYIKENLEIRIKEERGEFLGDPSCVSIQLLLEGDIISEDSIYIKE